MVTGPAGGAAAGGVRVSRSLRKACRTFETRVDTAFDEVVAACADPARDGRWITPAIARAYAELHRLGWAHSVEAWRDGELVGGLYGLAVGGLFAGESMFHHATTPRRSRWSPSPTSSSPTATPGGSMDVQWATAAPGEPRHPGGAARRLLPPPRGGAALPLPEPWRDQPVPRGPGA